MLDFLVALDGAEIRNLTLEPGKPVKGVRQVGILAGNAKGSKIFNCQVKAMWKEPERSVE